MPNLVLPDHQEGEVLPGIQPRQYQLDALGVLQDLRDKGVDRGLVTMATGLGKTAVAVLDVYNFLNAQQNSDSRFLFLTHRNEIIDQAWDRFRTPLAETGLDFRYLQPKDSIEALLNATFMFASFQMMHLGKIDGVPVREIFPRDHFDYVLTDEAHHATAPTYQPTLEHFQPQFNLGITATPDRRDTRNIRHIFGKEVFRKSLPEGIAEGYLARPHYIGIAPSLTVKVIRGDKESEEKLIGLDRATIAEIAEDIQTRTAHIKDPKILLYARSIQEADLYAEFLPNATALHSETSRSDRQDLLDDFRVTRPGTLTSVDILNEGIDVPDVDVIVMARSTASEIVFLQQLGRGLRKTADKDEVLVLDYVANSARLEMVARLINGFPAPREEREDDETKPRRKKKPKLEDIITSPQIDLENATFEFDASIIDIIQILHEREERTRLIAEQTTEKSVDVYLELCRQQGKLVSIRGLRDALGESQTELLLMPFEGRVSALRTAAGFAPLSEHPNMISLNEASKRLSTYIPKLERVIGRLDIEVLDMIGSNKKVTKSIKRANLEDIERMLHPPQRISTTMSIPSSQIPTPEARDAIAPGMALGPFRHILRDLDIVEHRQLGLDQNVRGWVVKGSFDRIEQGRVRDYVTALPLARPEDESLEEIARNTGEKLSDVYWAARQIKARGQVSRSPTSGRVETFLHPERARAIHKFLGK